MEHIADGSHIPSHRLTGSLGTSASHRPCEGLIRVELVGIDWAWNSPCFDYTALHNVFEKAIGHCTAPRRPISQLTLAFCMGEMEVMGSFANKMQYVAGAISARGAISKCDKVQPVSKFTSKCQCATCVWVCVSNVADWIGGYGWRWSRSKQTQLSKRAPFASRRAVVDNADAREKC